MKVRNAIASNPTQKCWVNHTYTAPQVVTNAKDATAGNTSAFWTGNAATSDRYDPFNREEAKVPDSDCLAIISSNAFPQPAVIGEVSLSNLWIE